MKLLKCCILALAMIALPYTAQAQILFQDSFEGIPAGGAPLPNWTFTTDNSAGSAWAGVINTNDYNYGFSGQDGLQYAVLHFDGVPNGTVTDVTGAITRLNVGTFAANTSYTLTYLIASSNFDVTTSLLDGSSVINSTSQTITASGTNIFVSTATVTFDTALNPSLVGHSIGIQTSIGQTVQYDRYFGMDNYVLTAVADVPEPATYVLLGLGLGVLFFAARRRVGLSE